MEVPFAFSLVSNYQSPRNTWLALGSRVKIGISVFYEKKLFPFL